VKFTSKLNQTYTTRPIVANFTNETETFYAVGRLTGATKTMYDSAPFAKSIRDALLELPNYVIDDVNVEVDWEDIMSINRNVLTDDANFRMITLWIRVEFAGETVQGAQHHLGIVTEDCSDGCTPKLENPIRLKSTFNHTLYHHDSTTTEGVIAFAQHGGEVRTYQTADYNSYECGRRGKCDYSTGLCECFEGYAGDRCNKQTSLV